MRDADERELRHRIRTLETQVAGLLETVKRLDEENEARKATDPAVLLGLQR